MYRRLARPLLFRLDAERAHYLTLGVAGLAGKVPGLAAALDRTLHRPEPSLTQTLWGQRFRSPVGLAAGLDKDAVAAPLLGALGFGFLEVGTVTPRGQPGNPAPRLFRLPPDGALINRMGFNNRGAEELAARLGRLPPSPRPVPLWVNIGKNRDTPLEEAGADYLACLRALAGVADGFVLNVSSPNTPGLRSLQAADELSRLVERLSAELHALWPGLPLLVKLSPDLSGTDFDASVNAAISAGASGLVVSNTT
ncbi:MAG: quinone-dependent dihydroorotate dehydrogenase, partial [Deinococcus sp.]